MNDYIKDLSYIISNCEMDNTYKMSWIRSIVEICDTNPNPKQLVHFDEVSPLIFKYYWNQSIFFDLEQGPNLRKRPKIHQLVKECIDEYQIDYGFKPELFYRVEDRVVIPVTKISNVLKQDVSHRFLKVGGHEYNTYKLNSKNKTIEIKCPEIVKEFSDILYELINYRWTQKLEDLNTSPKISQKVRGTDRGKISRKSLTPFKRFLDVENPRRKCFISGENINENDLSIDHVIPWSYMYSDDLWNLVYVKKGLNSGKSNRIPNEEEIIRLEKRNKKLLNHLEKTDISSKHIDELRMSVERDWVKKNWVGFKG